MGLNYLFEQPIIIIINNKINKMQCFLFQTISDPLPPPRNQNLLITTRR